MKLKCISLIILGFVLTQAYAKKDSERKTLKTRILEFTDLAPNNIEPDDMESLIRLLAHADLYMSQFMSRLILRGKSSTLFVR